MAEDNKKKKTMKLPIIISITLSIVIIILILFFTVDAKTLGQLSRVKIKYEFFLIAIGLNILYWFLWGARMKVVANAIDKNVKISLWESTKIVIANLFLAGITPSAAGGEPVRAYLLYKDGMTFGSATAAVLGERFIDAIFILIMIPIGLFIFKDIKDLGFISVGLTVGVVVFVLLIILFIYIIIRPNKVKSFLFFLSKKFTRFSKSKYSENKGIKRINSFVDDFHSSMYSLSSGNKKSLVLASILTVLFWSTGFLIPSFILLGLGLPPFFIESYAAQGLLLIIIMLPLTPGSAGIAEVGIYGLYGVLIGTSSGILIGVFVILYRFISFHMGLIAGAIFQYRIFKSVASFSMDMIKTHEEKPEYK
ncbi:MAG: flippase-like domain-containing protein [Candidatus Thermoplasmatota archaeon]|nr:flippase-like domain-containing protein [Candidatus Thermoplasmatota archaeon]